MFFTNFIPNPSLRYNLGFNVMYLLIAFLAYSIAYLIYQIIVKLIIEYKKYKAKMAWINYNKKMEEKNLELQQKSGKQIN